MNKCVQLQCTFLMSSDLVSRSGCRSNPQCQTSLGVRLYPCQLGFLAVLYWIFQDRIILLLLLSLPIANMWTRFKYHTLTVAPKTGSILHPSIVHLWNKRQFQTSEPLLRWFTNLLSIKTLPNKYLNFKVLKNKPWIHGH